MFFGNADMRCLHGDSHCGKHSLFQPESRESVHAFICVCNCLQAGLVPGSYVGMGNNGTGCFNTGADVTKGALHVYASMLLLAILIQSFQVCLAGCMFCAIQPC